ncbi:MAG: glutamate-1-semialdehyde 2,1-aminomutase [Dehalococcoidia bacterium]|nr:glutamate-1-semialdehyde 2,1-aminomutase [Dehalococcoidia bacterium]
MTSSNFKKSLEIMNRARAHLPGGVNSPVRAYRAVDGDPVVLRSGNGAMITDVDGNEYIDYVNSYGPLILGHAHPDVIHAVQEASKSGTSFGAPTEPEVDLAELVASTFPSIEMVRFVNSGTEAAMSAIRLARGQTKKDLIIKFEGCYHGHADGLLASAGSGVATFGLPDSPGVPAAMAAQTLIAPYNNLEVVKSIFEAHPDKIAAVVVEPVAGNMGVVVPQPEYLAGLRLLCDQNDALLIFDEVISGFRVSASGAQGFFDVHPDLTILGKIIGGGLPVGAYGGSRELMEEMAPTGDIYQAGTLSGNPIAMAAGLATLNILLADSEAYNYLNSLGVRLAAGLESAAKDIGIPLSVVQIGSTLTAFFQDAVPTNYDEATRSDTAMFAKFHREMLNRGVHLAPSQYEAWFLSLAHDEKLIDQTVNYAREALMACQSN